MARRRSQLWERTIEKLLGDDNPCKICLIKVTCGKSFTNKTACEPLSIKLNEALERIRNEDKD